jgi:hypothetical protein
MAVPWLRRLAAGLPPRRPVSIPGQSIWDLWWTKWHWDRFFPEYFGFPLSISFHRCSITRKRTKKGQKLTPWRRVLPHKLTDPQLVKNFPACYGTRRFITAFTSARRQSLTWTTAMQSMSPQQISWGYILILSSHPGVGLPTCLFPSGLHKKILYEHLLSPYTSHVPSSSQER